MEGRADIPPDRRWYVVMAKPGDEERVAEQLAARLGIETYLPRILVKVKRGRRMVDAVRPLFPRYLFVRLLLPEEWRLISFTRGVARVIGGWEDPQAIDDRVIEAIREQEVSPDRLIRYYNFHLDDRVYVKHGPMKDLYGIFERYADSRTRVRVLLTLVGYQVAVEMDAAYLEKA